MKTELEERRETLIRDPWESLKTWTEARIALGRVGTALPTNALLDFQLAYARARDAVGLACHFPVLEESLAVAGLQSLQVRSRVKSRDEYLRRPDLGRLLDPNSQAALAEHAMATGGVDIAMVAGDGLSSQAIDHQAHPMLEALVPLLKNAGYRLSPVILASQARVALSDEIGAAIRARIVIMLIGERPGLSSPDSLGIYLTFGPKRGRQNADRNCISNVRQGGMPFQEAAQRTLALVKGAILLGASGVSLKEDTWQTLRGPQSTQAQRIRAETR